MSGVSVFGAFTKGLYFSYLFWCHLTYCRIVTEWGQVKMLCL